MTMCYEASRSFTLSTSHTCTENHAPNASTTLEALPPMHARVRSHTNTGSAKPFRAPLSQNTQMQKTDKPYTEIEIEKNIYIYVYVHAVTHIHIYVHLHLHIIHVHVHVHVHMHTYIHVYIHIYTACTHMCFFAVCMFMHIMQHKVSQTVYTTLAHV